MHGFGFILRQTALAARRGSVDTCAIRPPHGSLLLPRLAPLLSKRKRERGRICQHWGDKVEPSECVSSPDVMRAISVIAAYRNSGDEL